MKRQRSNLTPKGIKEADVGIFLGSGLEKLVEILQSPVKTSYRDIPGFPEPTAPGHLGNLYYGKIHNVRCCLFQGRFHFYEGYSMREITTPVRFLKNLSAHYFIVTNAAGGINPSFKVGDIMRITDHINLFLQNPLRGVQEEPRFPSMANAYDRDLGQTFDKIAEEEGVPLRKGVYVGWSGPSLETPAEYRFLRIIGGDAVGMSTVPEVITANHQGLKVAGFSVITNIGIGKITPHSHQDVLKIARENGVKIARILIRWLKEHF